MNFEKVKQVITEARTQVGKAKMKNSLEILETIISEEVYLPFAYRTMQKDFVMLQNQYNDIVQQEMKGTLDSKDKNRYTERLLLFMDYTQQEAYNSLELQKDIGRNDEVNFNNPITRYSFNTSVSRFIIIHGVLLIVILFVMWQLQGFKEDQFIKLLVLFLGGRAVYAFPLMRYFNADYYYIELDKHQLIGNKSASFFKKIIAFHAYGLILMIILEALFPIIEFRIFFSVIIMIELLFGGYMGTFLTTLYRK